MSMLSVPTKIYLITLAFGLHQASNNECLDEFLALNDLTQVPEIFNITIDQTSILGSLALKTDNHGISTLLNMGAVPIHNSNSHAGGGRSDIGLVSEHCSLETYQLAVDRLPINNMNTKALHEIFIDIFEGIDKIQGYLKCKYFLTKIPIDRLTKLINYRLYGNNNLFRQAYYLYQQSCNTIGFQLLFEYGIKVKALLDHDSRTTLKDILELDPVLNELYNSYQIDIKEPSDEIFLE
jgi:hypothetical protein